MYNMGEVYMKKTVLYNLHEQMHAKIIEFGGTYMPLMFDSIQKEHHAVRHDVGVFDVSHMGNIILKGKDALQFTNYIVTSPIKSDLNRATYGLILNDLGYTIDDVLVYVLNIDHIFIVCNASNIDAVYTWLKEKQKGYDVIVENRSELISQIAIQGPKSIEYISKLLPYDYQSLYFMQSYTIDLNTHFIVSRSGYTGEDGVEIYGPHNIIIDLYQKLIDMNVKPIGLGARDTLRFEATLPLYGHELSLSIDPFEAGLTFAVKEGGFIGSEALYTRKKNLQKRLVALKLLEKNIPRAPYKVYNEFGDIVGEITTGYLLQTQTDPLALAMIQTPFHTLDTKLYVDIRDKKIPAVVIKKQFMVKKYHKQGE
jgi:aminomethyltransferase